MNPPCVITKDEQLAALAGGITAFYQLIEKHTGKPLSGDFRGYATVTKAELANYLRKHPGLAERHISKESDVLKQHDLPALISDKDHWIVCWIDHGRKVDEERFEDINEAAASFLMAYW
ncbi:MAG: hypothetical protein M0Q93_04385 [Terrimicrobiaceae bacterium]|jgi:hypothetical protein|nr:hypothetical protein [Terrimicrobiaceae bacterium]